MGKAVKKPQGVSNKKVKQANELSEWIWKLNHMCPLRTSELGVVSSFKELTTPDEKILECIRRELNDTNGLHPLTEFDPERDHNFLKDVTQVAMKACEIFFNPWTANELGEIKRGAMKLLKSLPKDKNQLVLLGRRTGDPDFFMDLREKLLLVKGKASSVEPKKRIRQKGARRELRGRNFIKNEIEKSIAKHFGRKKFQRNALTKAILKTDIVSKLGFYSPDSVQDSLFK